jgi:AraC-like DNA-binding protein
VAAIVELRSGAGSAVTVRAAADALILLATGALVTSVATACGYTGPSAFIQAFHSAFGTTPGRFTNPTNAAAPIRSLNPPS